LPFTCACHAPGPGALHGNPDGGLPTGLYFSPHTLTTVGFGSIAPKSAAASFVAAF
jgi:hypothetical protein